MRERRLGERVDLFRRRQRPLLVRKVGVEEARLGIGILEIVFGIIYVVFVIGIAALTAGGNR